MTSKPCEAPVLVTVADLSSMLNVSHKTIRRLVKHADFPPAVRLRGCLRWWRDDVLEHVRDKTGLETKSNS